MADAAFSSLKNVISSPYEGQANFSPERYLRRGFKRKLCRTVLEENIFIMPYGSYLCNIRQIWYKLIEYDLDSIKQVNVLFILT